MCVRVGDHFALIRLDFTFLSILRSATYSAWRVAVRRCPVPSQSCFRESAARSALVGRQRSQGSLSPQFLLPLVPRDTLSRSRPCWLPTVRGSSSRPPPGALLPTGRPLQPLPLPGRLGVLPATALPASTLHPPAPGPLLPLLRWYLFCGTLRDSGGTPPHPVLPSATRLPALVSLLLEYAFPEVLLPPAGGLSYLGTLIRM